MARKKWFDVTVKETYHATYKIYAADAHDADAMANDMVNVGDIDPATDGSQSYDRSVSVDEASKPMDGGIYWTKGRGRDSEACNYVWFDRSKKRTKAKGGR